MATLGSALLIASALLANVGLAMGGDDGSKEIDNDLKITLVEQR